MADQTAIVPDGKEVGRPGIMTDLNEAYRIAKEIVGDDPQDIGRVLPKLSGLLAVEPEFDEQERMEWRVSQKNKELDDAPDSI